MYNLHTYVRTYVQCVVCLPCTHENICYQSVFIATIFITHSVYVTGSAHVCLLFYHLLPSPCVGSVSIHTYIQYVVCLLCTAGLHTRVGSFSSWQLRRDDYSVPTLPFLLAHCVYCVLYVTLEMGVTAAVWVHEGEASLRWHLPFQHFVNSVPSVEVTHKLICETLKQTMWSEVTVPWGMFCRYMDTQRHGMWWDLYHAEHVQWLQS